ncbi:MAG: aldehyde dehydrogenase family protein [candidate division Zixibacteria bacterium]|nr:aldehyde dehydrogenase family protein [candidate division Zixibacteria bacterium]
MARVAEIIQRATTAAAEFRKLDQKQTDAIVRAAYLAALNHRVDLAQMACEETGLGVWKDKVVKNVIATQLVYEDIKDQRTVGVISVDPKNGMEEVAQSIGPILGFTPVTNPTSTTIFKALIALKTRNPLIISPAMAARKCTAAALDICYQAARGAGAPEHCLQCMDRASEDTITEMMSDHHLSLILATGTNSTVRKAYRSGKPTIGVGPGNVPVYIGRTADIAFAVENVVRSKTFDNGTVCASEQAIVVKQDTAAAVIAEFKKHGAHFMNPEEIAKVGAVAYDLERRTMKAGVVGQPVSEIARSAGITVPEGATLLIGQLDGVGPEYPISAEILAPILAFYVEKDFDTAIERCSEITRFGGVGHTAVIYSNTDERIEYFSRTIQAGRILVNMPSTYGALGGMYNTLSPSFTLSCGSGANNTTTDNITVRHLLNIHRITRRRPNPKWLSFDQSKYLDSGISAERIESEYNRNF